MGRVGSTWLALLLAALLGGPCVTAAETLTPRFVTLDQCLELALRQNRELQIERLNPAIARANLSSAFGYYDPVFTSDYRHDQAADNGGFDPSDFSRDAIYSAESDVMRLGMVGFLPTGLSYAFTGSYANSFGERNLLNFDSFSMTAGVTVRQPLLKNLWIDQGRLVIRVNRKLLRMTELGVNWLVLDVANRVQQAYYELLYAREHLDVQLELRDSRRRTLGGLERQAQQGVLTDTDTLPTRMQLASLNTTLLGASNAVVLAENELKTLLGDDFREQADKALHPIGRLSVEGRVFDLQGSWHTGLQRRPDLAQLRTDVERGDIDLKFRRNQLFPSLDLVAGYGRRGASTAQLPPPLSAQASAREAFDQLRDGTAPNNMIGVIFSLPLSRVAERANYRASRHLKEQAELRVKQLEELILREISDAVQTARLTLDRVHAASQAAEFARRALDTEERKLTGGRSSIFFVLQLQNDLLAARAMELRAKADHLQAVSQLGFAEASLLDQLAIQIQQP
jgi:outer membrane protein